MGLYKCRLLLAVAWLLSCQRTCGQEMRECRQKSDCSCSMSDGSGVVDFTSITGSGNAPRFKDVQCAADGNYYSFSPCGSFEENTCVEAASCMIDSSKQVYTRIGMANEARFQYDPENGHILVGYFSQTRPLRLTELEAVCDESACDPVFTPVGEQESGQLYKFQMKSICACPGKCSTSGPIDPCKSGSSSGAISGGSVFLIVVVAILCIYLIGGVLYMKLKKKASGTDLIPNKDMWKSLPALVKRGFLYCISLCSSKRRGLSTQ